VAYARLQKRVGGGYFWAKWMPDRVKRDNKKQAIQNVVQGVERVLCDPKGGEKGGVVF
jgi:hypothetical protein